MLKMNKKKGKKASLDITQIFSVVIAIITASAVYLIFTAESGINAEMIRSMDNAMIKNAYANLIATSSCLIANDSLMNKRYYRLNITYVKKELKNWNAVDCINFPNFEYVIRISVNSKDLSNIEEEYVFNNTDEFDESAQPIKYYIVTTDGRTGIISFTYLNIKEEKKG